MEEGEQFGDKQEGSQMPSSLMGKVARTLKKTAASTFEATGSSEES